MNFKPFIFLFFQLFECSSSKSLVSHLPGYVGNDFPTMYTGYINVDVTSGRHYFYWYCVADEDSASKPLIFWFQGGPGSRSEFGLFFENGPLYLESNTTVSRRTFGSWTNFANVVFIDNPSCVGYSYSTNASDCLHNTDTRSATDLHIFIRTFILHEFSSFKGRPFWLSTESYGGVYLPTTAAKIVDDHDLKTSFKGLTLGNPVFQCMDKEKDGTIYANFHLYYFHGFVTQDLFEEFENAGCNSRKAQQGENKPICRKIFNKILIPSDFSYDNIFMDQCVSNGTLDLLESIGPCDSYYGRIVSYISNSSVQKALHVHPRNESQPWNYKENLNSMIPFYEHIYHRSPHARILIYSGLLDIATVPFPWTKICVRKLTERLHLQLKEYNTFIINGHTGGFFERYDRFIYATVRGAGHEALGFQPLSTFNLIKTFINNNTLPKQQRASDPQLIPMSEWWQRRKRLRLP